MSQVHAVRVVLSTLAFLYPLAGAVAQEKRDEPTAGENATDTFRLGIIGVDTSHALAFTKLLQGGEIATNGCRVVAAYPRGSWDIPSSVVRLEKNTQAMRDAGVEIVPSIAALLERVDGVLLETNDGRPHLEQVIPVLKAHKPVFIDKPIAGSLTDAIAIYELGKFYATPLFSSSSLRYAAGVEEVIGGKVGEVLGADVFSPAPFEPTHPDLYWYGIHGAEILYTVMGGGCERVTRAHSPGSDVVVGQWNDGRLGVLRGIRQGRSGYGGTAFGSKGIADLGPYTGYGRLVEEIAKFVRSGKSPVPGEVTTELYAFMSAADESRRRGGATVEMAEVLAAAKPFVSGGVVIDAAYPGGNIVVEGMEGDVVSVRQDLRDTGSWWFHWNFRVRGAAGRTLTFRFDGRSPIGTRGPAVSGDHGKTWRWLGGEAVEEASFRYAFDDDADAVRFAFSVPYQLADWRRFLERWKDDASLRPETLGETRRHRALEALRCGRVDGEAPYRILLTGRHHACETTSGYVLEGVIEALLGEAAPGPWLREHAEFFVVPFVDLDGVEEGDQGKLRDPHDHNRDYGAESIYPAVRSIRERIPQWADGRLRVAIDLHAPYISGGRNEEIFFVAVPGEEAARELGRFAALLESSPSESSRKRTLPYRAKNNLPFGSEWNAAEQGIAASSAHWMAKQRGVRLAATLEVPYATAGGVEVTPESLRAFGHHLARAITAYLADGGN